MTGSARAVPTAASEARHDELAAALEAIRGRQFEGGDPTLLVRVTVDGDGAFLDLKIDASRLHDTDSTELAAGVLTALAAARQTLATELNAAVGGDAIADVVDKARAIDLVAPSEAIAGRPMVEAESGAHA